MQIDLIPGYRLETQLGQGAAGSVYRAHDPNLDRWVAIKVLRQSLPDPDAKARFLREAQTLAQNPHPGILPVLDFGIEPLPYLVLPLLSGGDLGDLLDQAGGLDPATREELARSLFNALAHVHRQGILHRDLKLANILVEDGARFLLSDFGLAFSEEDERLTRTGAIVGTPSNMAPEVFHSGQYSPGTDLYAVGILLLEVTLGRRVTFPGFQTEKLAALLEEVPPSPWKALLKDLLREDPKQRIPDAREALRRLTGESGASPREPLAPVPPPQGRFLGLWVGWVALGLLVGWNLSTSSRSPQLPASPGVESPPPEAAQTKLLEVFQEQEQRFFRGLFLAPPNRPEAKRIQPRELHVSELQRLEKEPRFEEYIRAWLDARKPRQFARLLETFSQLRRLGPGGHPSAPPGVTWRFFDQAWGAYFTGMRSIRIRARQHALESTLGKVSFWTSGDLLASIDTRVLEVREGLREILRQELSRDPPDRFLVATWILSRDPVIEPGFPPSLNESLTWAKQVGEVEDLATYHLLWTRRFRRYASESGVYDRRGFQAVADSVFPGYLDFLEGLERARARLESAPEDRPWRDSIEGGALLVFSLCQLLVGPERAWFQTEGRERLLELLSKQEKLSPDESQTRFWKTLGKVRGIADNQFSLGADLPHAKAELERLFRDLSWPIP